jgi:heterogeneous nuclear rnp K-like protein 2
LNASGSTLPLSTERSLVVTGVADAVHIATYYIANTLVEQLTERYGGPAASAYATRTGGPAGPIPGGMQVIPYQPQPLHGSYGHPDTFKRHTNSSQRTPANPYGMPYLHGQAPAPAPQAPIHYPNPQDAGGYSGAGPHQPGAAVGPAPQAGQAAGAMAMLPGQPLTQQIFIPNDMVGAIIGKGGAKINEIRQLSGSVIKINEPQDNSNERLVTITGTQECNQMALYMLYSRLGKLKIIIFIGCLLIIGTNRERKAQNLNVTSGFFFCKRLGRMAKISSTGIIWNVWSLVNRCGIGMVRKHIFTT